MTLENRSFSVQDRAGERPALLTTSTANFDVQNLHNEGRSMNSNGEKFRSVTDNAGGLDFSAAGDVYKSGKVDFSTARESRERQSLSALDLPKFEDGGRRDGRDRYLDFGNESQLYDDDAYNCRRNGGDRSYPNSADKPGTQSNSQSIFDGLDLNKSGSISENELSQVTVSKLLEVDKNDDGSLDLNEVLSSARQNGGNEFLTTLGFQMSDGNRDGRLDFSEMQKIGQGFSSAAMKFGDTDGDGKLSIDEFSRLSGDCPSAPKPPGQPQPPLDKPPGQQNPPVDNPPGQPRPPLGTPPGQPEPPVATPPRQSDPPVDSPPRNPGTDTFGRWDANNSGELEHKEIQAGVADYLRSQDDNGDGLLDGNELKENMGSNSYMGRIARVVDNGDGKLDASEQELLAAELSNVALEVYDTTRDPGKTSLGPDDMSLTRGQFANFARDNGIPTDGYGQNKPAPPVDSPSKPGDKPGDTPSDKPGDKPGTGIDGVARATDAQIREAMTHVENRGASQSYINEIEQAMREMPSEFVQALNEGRTKVVAYGQGPEGLGGSYNSGTNTITMYETAPFSTKGVLACEMAHNWDLNPYVGEHMSSQPWFRDAYQRAMNSGISQGDNSYNNVYEFIHHMAKYYSGITGGSVGQLMDYLGPDYKSRTRQALA